MVVVDAPPPGVVVVAEPPGVVTVVEDGAGTVVVVLVCVLGPGTGTAVVSCSTVVLLLDAGGVVLSTSQPAMARARAPTTRPIKSFPFMSIHLLMAHGVKSLAAPCRF